MKIIDLFCGIGGIRLGFEHYGCECVFSSDWDKDAQTMYENFFGEKPHGDITQILPEDIPDHDILLGGFPCQAFSILGKKEGFNDTRGTLFFNIEKILATKRPYAFLLENVKQLKTHDKGRTFRIILEILESLGYYTHSTVLNALDFGVPQKRERTFIVGFRDDIEFSFPKKLSERADLSTILEPEESLPKSLFVSDRIREDRFAKAKQIPDYPTVWHQNKGGNISPLPYSCALRASASYNYLLVNGKRRLSGREMMRLQGFPDDYEINIAYTAVRKVTGNSVAVPVIRAIAGQMIKSLNEKVPREYFEQLSLLTDA